MAIVFMFTNCWLCHYRDAFLIPIINCLTSFYAGFVIFAVLGFMAKQKGTTVAEVATGGTSKLCLFGGL